MRNSKLRKSLIENLQAYMFVGPFVVLASVFMIYPIFNGFVTSFYNTKWAGKVFVGLKNYIDVFTSDISILALRNTLLYVVTVVPLLIVFGIWIAGSVFDKMPRYVTFVRVCIYLPVIASMVVIHGFASSSEFSLIRQTDIELVFALRDTIATRVNYPFDFTFEITYRLVGHTIVVQNKVYNKSAAPMHFALGGHPGFRVPIGNGEKFEDYYLEFSKKCVPDRVGFTSDTILLNGQTERYNLEEETKLHLKHDLFDDDAIILQNVSRQVTLKNSVSSRCVTVSYPDMSYLGIWHWPNTDAPYVCIEPWTSLPGRSGVLEEISSRSDFVHLASGKCYENVWTITIGE